MPEPIFEKGELVLLDPTQVNGALSTDEIQRLQGCVLIVADLATHHPFDLSKRKQDVRVCPQNEEKKSPWMPSSYFVRAESHA